MYCVYSKVVINGDKLFIKCWIFGVNLVVDKYR